MLTTAQISFNHTFGSAGGYYEPTHEGSEASVEMVASIFATQPSDASAGQPSSSSIQQVEDLLSSIPRLQQLAIVARALDSGDDEAFLRMVGQQRVSALRGESYAQHGRDLALEIFAGPAETWMRGEFGFSIDEFFTVAEATKGLVVERVNSHLAGFADEMNSLGVAQGDELTEEQGLAVATLFHSCFEELPRLLVFTADEVAAHGNIDRDLANGVIERLSLAAGELEAHRYRSPLDPTPLAQRPFLRVGDRVVLPVAGHLLRSTNDLFEKRLLGRFNRFSKHRANVVDRVALDLLERALPGSRLLGPAYYEFGDGDGVQRYETDGIVDFEDFCLVVEGKGGALSVQAQRGDITRLQRDIGTTLRDAWDQCARVRRYLRSTESVTFADERGHEQLTVDRSQAKSILYVNPMLHTLGVYAFQLPRLRALGQFGSDGEPWPVLVTDLRVITDIASGPAELLHFMEWRSALPIGDGITVIDELDVFGTYLFGGVGRMAVGEGEHLMFGSSTSDFDDYYGGLAGEGPPRPRPRRVLGDWLEDQLDRLAKDRPAKWLQRSFAILDLSLTEAAALCAWAESGAQRELGRDRWCVQVFARSAFVGLRSDVAITEVLLELGPVTSRADRWFVVRLDDDGPVLIHSERRRRQTQ